MKNVYVPMKRLRVSMVATILRANTHPPPPKIAISPLRDKISIDENFSKSS
jgi:hypothetical protein